MAIQVNIGAAKTRLSELVAAMERGEEVVIARANVPVARLTPVASDVERVRAQRLAYIGSMRGAVPDDIDWTEPAFTDAELDAFEASFPDPPA